MANLSYENRKPGVQQQTENRKSDTDRSLRGTFASVMILGAFLVVSWVAVFMLFLMRG